MSPTFTYTTPELKQVIGEFSQDLIYTLIGTANEYGVWDSTTLLSNFNTQWANHESGGTWVGASNTSMVSITQTNTTGSFSKWLTSGINWPRQFSMSIWNIIPTSGAGSRSFNLFCCVQGISDYYRFLIVYNSTTSVTLSAYKNVAGTETPLSTSTITLAQDYTLADQHMKWTVDVLPTKIVLSYGHYNAITPHTNQLIITDTTLTYGSFGFGTKDSYMSFKGPFISTTPKTTSAQVFRLFSRTSNLTVTPSTNSLAVPFEVFAPNSTGSAGSWTWWSQSSGNHFYRYGMLSSISQTTMAIFRTKKLRDFTIWCRNYSRSASRTHGFIIDFQNNTNFVYIWFSGNDTKIIKRVNGTDNTLVTVSNKTCWESNQYQEWRISVSGTNIKIVRNTTVFYDASPSGFRGTTDWQIGKVGLIANGSENSLIDTFEIHESGDILGYEQAFQSATAEVDTLSRFVEPIGGGTSYVISNKGAAGVAGGITSTDVFSMYNATFPKSRVFKFARYKVSLYCTSSGGGVYWASKADGRFRLRVTSMTTIALDYYLNGTSTSNEIQTYTNVAGAYIGNWLNLEIQHYSDLIVVYLNGTDIMTVSLATILAGYPSYQQYITPEGLFGIQVASTKDTYWKDVLILTLGRNKIGSGSEMTDVSETIKQSGGMLIEYTSNVASYGSVIQEFQKLIQLEGTTYRFDTVDLLAHGSTWFPITKDLSVAGSSILNRTSDIDVTGRVYIQYLKEIAATGNITKTYNNDLSSVGSILLTSPNTINCTGRSYIQYLNAISVLGDTLKTLIKDLSVTARAYPFQYYLLTAEYQRDEWTASQSVYFTLISQIWDDPAVLTKSWALWHNSVGGYYVAEGEFDDQTITVNFSNGDGEYFFVAKIYDHGGNLIGQDTYKITLDTVSPIIQYLRMINIPFYEGQQVQVSARVDGLMLNSMYELTHIILFKNGDPVDELYFESYDYNPDGTFSKTFPYNGFLKDDQIDIYIGVQDAAGNTDSWNVGHNYDGDGTHAAGTFIALQRYVYKLAVWHGTYSNNDFQKKYCRNFGYDLERGYVCPLHEAGTMFLPGVRSDCPYCHFPLVSGNFKLDKRLVESNIRHSVPIKETLEEGIAILKFGLTRDNFFLPSYWLMKIEERSTPYGQDVLYLGYYDVPTISLMRKAHVQIQISRGNAFFQQDLILVEDTLGDELSFQYQLSDGSWKFIPKNGLDLQTATIRYLPSIFIEPGIVHYYRWRVIEVEGAIENQGSWLPSGTGKQAFTMTKFASPDESWDGRYREYLLQNNLIFCGMTKSNPMTEPRTFFDVSGTITKVSGASAYRITSDIISFFDFNPERGLAGANEHFSIIKVRVRSNNQIVVSPTLRNTTYYRTVLGDKAQIVAGDEKWHVLTFDVQSDIYDGIWWSAGFAVTPSGSGAWFEVDYFALVDRRITPRKYAYLHITSGTMKCVFDQKKTTADPFGADGFCLRGHSAETKYSGIWASASSYAPGDVVKVLFGSTFYYFVAIQHTWSGVTVFYGGYWQYIGTVFDETSDGLYKGGSRTQNPQTTGYCRNTVCPHYTAEEKIDEAIDFIYDPNAPSITDNIFSTEIGGVSGMYYCPNNRSDDQGRPLCRNNKFRVAFPPKYKVCSRLEGDITNPSGSLGSRRFRYRCNRFNTEEDVYLYDTGGVNATTGSFSTKIPANQIYDSSTETYHYEQAEPKRFRWDYEDTRGACDGSLRDTSVVCGAPLVGVQGLLHCPECGTGLVPYERANSHISALKCSNSKRTTRMIPHCHLAQAGTPQPSDASICYECGEPTYVFDARALISIFIPNRSVDFTGEELNLLADGLPKTLAYRGWDSILNHPYTGLIGGSGGPLVEGAFWQGAQNFRRLKATVDQIARWEEEKEISTNLSTRMTSELAVIQTKKNNAYAKQYFNSVANGDIESAIRRPNYVSDYTMNLMRDFLIDNGRIESGNRVSISYRGGTSTPFGFMKSKMRFSKPDAIATDPLMVEVRAILTVGDVSKYAEGDVLGRIVFDSKLTKLARWYLSEYNLSNPNDYYKVFGFYFQYRSGLCAIYAAGYDEVSNSYQEHVFYSAEFDYISGLDLRFIFYFYPNSVKLEVINAITSGSYGQWTLNYTANHVYPADQCSLILLNEKTTTGYLVQHVKVTGILAQNSEKFRNQDSYEKRNLKLSEPGKSTIDEYDQLYFFNKFSTGEIQAKGRDEWSETYYMIEYDPKPTFDSRRGQPMRRIWGRGWTCLRKSNGIFDNPSGSFASEYCPNYKRVWSDEEAKSMSFSCPRCGNGLYLARLDSSLLSLAGADGTKELTPLSTPKIEHLLLREELPGLHREDYLMLDSNPRNGTIDQLDTTIGDSPSAILNPFFKDSDINDIISTNVAAGWTKANSSEIVDSRRNTDGGNFGPNRDKWFDGFSTESAADTDSSNYVADSFFVKNSAYLSQQDLPTEGRLVEQIVRSRSGQRNYENSAVYYTTLKQRINISSDNLVTKKGKLSDIRWSCYVPSPVNSFSAMENHFIGTSALNVTRKISMVEVAVYTGYTQVATMKYIISDSLYDYWDTFGFTYTYPTNPWVKFMRIGRLWDKDKWLSFQQNVYDDLLTPLQSQLGINWSVITDVEFRMSTMVVRAHDWQGLPMDHRRLTNVGANTYAPTIALTIWREFLQGWQTIIPTGGDGKTVKYGPKTWDGIYYYRIVPYSYRLNPQWLDFYKKVFLGLGPTTSWLHMPLEEWIRYYGVDPQRWLYRFQDPIVLSQFKYNYAWHTTYSGLDHVVLPEGMVY